MDATQLQHTYEQVDNHILRLLFYFAGAVIATLSAVLSYLWREWRAEQRERIELDKATAKAMMAVADNLDDLRDAVDEFRRSQKQRP